MTLEEIKKKKRDLEFKIETLILEFKNETDIPVDEILIFKSEGIEIVTVKLVIQ